MTDGTLLNLGSGGNTVWDKDNGDGTHTPASLLVFNGGASPYKTLVSSANPLPVQEGDGTHQSPAADAAARARYVIACDGTNPIGTSTNPLFTADANNWTEVPFPGTQVSAQVKGSAGKLGYVYATNEDAAERYLWLWNLTSPGSSTTNMILVPFMLPPKSWVLLDSTVLTRAGRAFSTGLSFGISSSPTSFSTSGVVATEHNVLAGIQ